ncbi:MAG: glycosyl hydrolase 53 family protein [Alphaproteobacteria bacterium]|nr:glycosyl hydrolase 53 family protein [Alphaproteobacteria bacterium]
MKSTHLLLLAALIVAAPTAARPVYFGADLSFANEMDDCGVVYRENGQPKDLYALFKEHGANMARVRIWTDGNTTGYSNLPDVIRSFKRMQAQGMKTVLDFHYSDWWADGGKQIIPKAWAGIKDPQALSKVLYRYTFDTLMALNKAGVMPDVVQPGNEINHEILAPGPWRTGAIDWKRNALLLNAAIRAIRDAGRAAGKMPKVMIQIAQPENVRPWFAAATKAGVTDFDMIGISYYPKWSMDSIAGLGRTINLLRNQYPGVDVLVIETAYPWTLTDSGGPSGLARDDLSPGYPATPEGQKAFLIDLSQVVLASGGAGVFTWAPDWIPSACTRKPHGVDWEVMSFFDRSGNVLPGIDHMDHAYAMPVTVTFRFHGAGAGDYRLWGDMFGDFDGVTFPLKRQGDTLIYTTTLMPGTPIRFQVYGDQAMRKPLLAPSRRDDVAVSETVPDKDTVYELDLKGQ